MKKFSQPLQKSVSHWSVKLTKTVVLENADSDVSKVTTNLLDKYAKAGFSAQVNFIKESKVSDDLITEGQSYTHLKGNNLAIGQFSYTNGKYDFWKLFTPSVEVEKVVITGSVDTKFPALFSYSDETPYATPIDLDNILYKL